VTGGPAPPWRVYHRPRKGRGVRWRLVATVATFAAAVRLIDRGGDWWLTDRPEAET
jgi:hypothetical protein